MKINDVFNIKDTNYAVARVKQGGYAFITESAMAEYEISKDCDLEQVGGLLNTVYYAIGMKNGQTLFSLGFFV